MRNTVLKIAANGMLVMLPAVAMAHEGHGSSLAVVHSMEHSVVLFGALAVPAIGLFLYRKAKRQDN